MADRRSLISSLRRASDRALRDAETWPELAAFIDELHAEHERFLTLINERKIGAHVSLLERREARLNRRRRG